MRTTADIATQQNEGISKSAPNLLSALTLPERIPADWAISAALLVLTTAYLLLFRRYTFSPDEGITLQGAQRVLQGQVMYRDFFYFCTPGSYYLLALLFRIFGSSIIVARTALAVDGGIFALLTYLIARRVCARWSALVASYLVTVALLPSCFFALHNWDSTLWAYITLYCAVWLLQRPHWGWALGMGTCCGITVLFEQSKGACLLLGLTVGFGILWACHQIHVKRTQILAALAGIVWPVVLATGYFASQDAFLPMVKDMLSPFLRLSRVNSVPYGYLNWGSVILNRPLPGAMLILFLSSPYFLISALPIFGVGILVYSTVRGWRMRHRQAERWAYYVLVSACTSGLLLSVLASRKDASHFVFIAPIVSLILCWFLDGSDIRLRTVDHVRPLVVAAIVLAFTLLGFSQLVIANGFVSRETRRGIIKVPMSETALDYLRMHTRPGEEIFVYPYYPTYYYLTATSNPTPYDYMHPGLHTPEQFEEAMNRIAARRPQVVLFDPSFYGGILVSFPSTPIRGLASRDPLADFILAEYRPCAVLVPANTGNFVFMVRKDLPCPQAPAGGAEPKNGDPKVKAPPLNSVEPREPSQDAR
jgi:4-amino-4-deoxy-L-arabinose transferase-like glycosyltransferase